MGLGIKIFTKGPIFAKGPKLILDLTFGAFNMVIMVDLASKSRTLLGNWGHLP